MKLTSDNFDEWSSNGTNELAARARVGESEKRKNQAERENEKQRTQGKAEREIIKEGSKIRDRM